MTEKRHVMKMATKILVAVLILLIGGTAVAYNDIKTKEETTIIAPIVPAENLSIGQLKGRDAQWTQNIDFKNNKLFNEDIFTLTSQKNIVGQINEEAQGFNSHTQTVCRQVSFIVN